MRLIRSLANISSPPQVKESSSQKVSWMQQAATKLCLDGRWSRFPSGAAAAKKSIQRNLDWLQGYEEIVLFFDNDEPGRQATEAACQVLPPGKVKTAHLQGDYKDASDSPRCR